MPELDEEEFTELVDGHFPRVDLVGKAANGVPRFLVAKGAAGTFEADIVRELVEKADGKVPTTTGEEMPNVAKAGELDASEPFAEEPNPMDAPGSPEWEQLDAATAAKWLGILARAKNAIQLLAGREAQEVFSGADGADGTDVFDLEDTCYAIESAIESLAPFAVGEQAEAELADEVAKAAWVLGNSTTINTIEELGAVVKAGRTLSAQNEHRIREAVESLQTVLSTLPEPVAKEKLVEEEVVKDQPAEETEGDVAKAGALTATSPHDAPSVTDDPGPGSLPHGEADKVNDGHEVTASSDTTDRSGEADSVGSGSGVMKASGEPMMAVYSSSGKLLGAVDPSKITELQDGGDTDVDAPPEAPPTDLNPAPSGTVGMAPAAAGSVAKSTDEVVEAAIAKAIKEVADAKDAEHASVVKSLEDRIAALEAPAPSRVLSSGALPPAHLLRGLTEGGTVDVAKAEELRRRLEEAPDQASREAVAKEMNAQAVLAWQGMRDSRYQPNPTSA